MTFKEWAFSSYPNPTIDGRWGSLHIITLILSILIIILIAILFRNKSEKTRKIVFYSLVGVILFFEIARRTINFIKSGSNPDYLYIILPRPWCAISSWSLILTLFVRKQFLYNFSCFSSLLCAIIFFAYPSVGFNNQYILFENLYSITAHMLLLITSISLITLKFTNFKYKTMWKELLYLVFVFAYALFEIFILKVEPDPMYFMPNNEVQAVLSVGYVTYILIYFVFLLIYINIFYLINDRKFVFKNYTNNHF